MTRRNITRKFRGGSTGLSPAPYSDTGVQLTPGGLNTLPNTVADPTDYSSNIAKVAGRGCAGTRLNTVAAKGMYKPYSMKGGSNLVRLEQNPLVGTVTGPRAGYAAVGPGSLFNPAELQSLESLGAGPVAGIGVRASKYAAPVKGGGKRRKTARKHSKNGKKHRRKSRKAYCGKKTRGKRGRKRTSRKRMYKGGAGQPYNNIPITHGYSVGAPFNSTKPVFQESALANPPPIHAYNNCQKNNFVKKVQLTNTTTNKQ